MLITNEKTFFQCQVLRGLERSHCRATLVSHTMPTTKRSTAFMTDNGYIYDTCLRGDLPNKENFLVVCSMYSNKFHPDKGWAIKNLKKGKFGSIFPRGKYIILTALWPYIQNSKGKVICKIIKMCQVSENIAGSIIPRCLSLGGSGHPFSNIANIE